MKLYVTIATVWGCLWLVFNAFVLALLPWEKSGWTAVAGIGMNATLLWQVWNSWFEVRRWKRFAAKLDWDTASVLREGGIPLPPSLKARLEKNGQPR